MTPEALIAIRKRNQRPAGPVCLSLVGKIKIPTWPQVDYCADADLRGLHGLDVVVAGRAGGRYDEVLTRLLSVQPQAVVLWLLGLTDGWYWIPRDYRAGDALQAWR